jgi:hypothetical protein
MPAMKLFLIIQYYFTAYRTTGFGLDFTEANEPLGGNGAGLKLRKKR